jgi:hypothetical protein
MINNARRGDMQRFEGLIVAVLTGIIAGSFSVGAQDTLTQGTACYADILDDWKDQDKVTSTGGYRTAVTAIVATLPATDRAPLQQRLDALASSASTSAEMEKLYISACSARRIMRMSAYVAKFQKVLFSEHAALGGLYFFDNVPNAGGVAGKGLQLLTMNGYYGSVTSLLSGGEARHADVSFDGKRAVFPWRGGSSGSSVYHLYEIDLATKQTKQLTSGSGEFTIDLDPAYLPNGDIVFVSTRFAQEIDCIAGRVTNLMLCNKDGKYMRQIGFDQVPIIYPRVMPSGEVVYCRWDYNDKSHTYAHALFIMNPDGTAQREYCNNNSWWPTMILQERPIPGSTKVMAMLGGYHTKQWGKIGIIDVNVGIANGEGVTLVAPVRQAKNDNSDTWGNPSGGPHAWRAEDAAQFPRQGAAPLDQWGQNPPMFAYPCPIDENAFIVSYRPASKESSWNGRMALYFMTVDGQREMLYSDAAGACMGATLAMPRTAPPVVSSNVNYEDSLGTLQVMKVNLGLSLPGVADGVIKRLRVAELYFRPGPAGAGAGPHCGPGCINFGGATYHTKIAVENASWDAKWIVGETPVQSDGSANFKVPARAPLFLQALNAKGQVVQTMRSWLTLQPGETFQCMGCHDSKTKPTPPLTYTPVAMQSAPLKLEPFYGPRRGFTFDKEIQPIFNAKCITCHNGGTNGGGLDLRQGTAYGKLTAKANSCDARSKYVSWFHAEDSPLLQPPYRAGSIKSRIDSVLDKGHKNLAVTDEEMRKIRCWIDLGVPQWGTYKEAHAGSENNLSIRNTWLAQEKKNIADFITFSKTAVVSGRHGQAQPVEGAAGVGFWCTVRHSGAVKVKLNVPHYAAGGVFSVNLYNPRGALMGTLFEKNMPEGLSTMTVGTSGQAAGHYLVELRGAGVRKVLPVVIVR